MLFASMQSKGHVVAISWPHIQSALGCCNLQQRARTGWLQARWRSTTAMSSFQGSLGRHWRLPYIRTPGCLARLKGCRHHAHALGMCSRQLLPVPTWSCYLHTPSPRHHLAFVRPFRRKRCDVTSFSCVCESNCICKTRQITVCHFRSQATRSAQH